MLVYQDVCYKTRSCSFSQSIMQNASINGPRVSGNLANDNHQGKCSFPNELLFGEIDHEGAEPKTWLQVLCLEDANYS